MVYAFLERQLPSVKLGALFGRSSLEAADEGACPLVSLQTLIRLTAWAVHEHFCTALLAGALHIPTSLSFRLLLQLSQSQQTSFALERNLRTQEEIEDKMKGFSFPKDTLLLIIEVSIPLGFM